MKRLPEWDAGGSFENKSRQSIGGFAKRTGPGWSSNGVGLASPAYNGRYSNSVRPVRFLFGRQCGVYLRETWVSLSLSFYLSIYLPPARRQCNQEIVNRDFEGIQPRGSYHVAKPEPWPDASAANLKF